MSYKSIDQIQNLLSETIFSHTESPKKAAGRALGTFIEIIGFYPIKTWGHEYSVAIERPLPEYANPEIMHNVEFTFHRNKFIGKIEAPKRDSSISSTQIFNNANLPDNFQKTKTSRNLINNELIKNACTFAFSDSSFCNAYFSPDKRNILLYELFNTPYAMFECKRVGIEKGMGKGPQTIEKAKQGSYVARTVSSIQRIRFRDGRIGGAIERNGKFEFYDDYCALIEKAVFEHDAELLSNLILTVGIVSNHGNWFTSDNHNKEMKVLAQSYDWLLFLTDTGLSSFVHDILEKRGAFSAVKMAFENSYEKGKKINRFTKTNMDYESDIALTEYFVANVKKIESWFNVITPRNKSISELRGMLTELNRVGV